MERTQRPRREVSASTIRGLSALFRYSASRDAYVLRGIGNRFGPVLKRKIERMLTRRGIAVRRGDGSFILPAVVRSTITFSGRMLGLPVPSG
jgi:hypothetical protein